MKSKSIITVVAFLLFVISFFLPAFDGGKNYTMGYQCAKMCAIDLWDVWDDDFWDDDFYSLLYYFPFTFSNLIMLVLPPLLLTRCRYIAIPKYVIGLQIILLLHVLSWICIGLANNDINDIRVGYYIWLLSMFLILYVTICSRKAEQGSGDNAISSPEN